MAPPRGSHARISVLLAREAPVGVVIRRGPAKQVCTLLWDRSTDEFHLGQWLKGRIYERRSDLSPDGKHLIYFASAKRRNSSGSTTLGMWTAVSRAPYLKAIATSEEFDTWHGGGLFPRNGRYWLNGTGWTTSFTLTVKTTHTWGWGQAKATPPAPPDETDAEVAPDPNVDRVPQHRDEDLSLYHWRLLRDGWQRIGPPNVDHWNTPTRFERLIPGGWQWRLRKLAHDEMALRPGKPPGWDEHELERPGKTIACPDWDWADVDGERLVWASGGKLFAARLDRDGLTDITELHDFNAMTFEPVVAPY